MSAYKTALLHYRASEFVTLLCLSDAAGNEADDMG